MGKVRSTITIIVMSTMLRGGVSVRAVRALLIISATLSVLGCSGWFSQGEDFDLFFDRFRSEKAFELDRTVFPLAVYRDEFGVTENGEDDSQVVKSEISKAAASRQPVLSEYIAEHDLSFQVESAARRDAVRMVKVFKANTDWLIEYRFELKNGQWWLVSEHDHSL